MKETDGIKSIINKYIKGNCNPDELETAMNLFADPYLHNREIQATLIEYWNNTTEDFEKEIPAEDLSLILDKVHHHIKLKQDEKPKSRVRSLVLTVSKVAAILLIGLLAGLSVQYLKKTEPLYVTSIAPKGSVAQMVLPDNSIIYLNAGSQLKYTVEGRNGKREVFLDGEAWFDVTKNEKMPFVVHTSFYDVNVIGTQFNVKAYNNDTEVTTTLEEGSVHITSSENLILAETTVLEPGEQLVYNPQSKTINVKTVETRMFTSWKDNKLIFINMNLKELFVVLERKYGVDIQVTNNLILDYHYDGTIKNENILEVLDLLKETLPIKYKIEGQNILITK